MKRESREEERKIARAPTDLAVRRALVECHADMLAYLRHRLGDSRLAEEALHEGVVRALKHAAGLRDVGNVRSWLRRVITSAAIDYLRARTRQIQAEVPIAEIADRSAVDVEDDAEATACLCLYKLLPTLPSAYADVLWRADLLSEPREQIALDLNTTVANITVRLHRARRSLRERLLETCRTCPVHGFDDCRCVADYTSQQPVPLEPCP